MATSQPVFPTILHQEIAKLVNDYFSAVSAVDTILVVNSCARGKAVPESDLDFAILVRPDTSPMQIRSMENDWQTFSKLQPAISKYRQSSPFAHLHLDIIDGRYQPSVLEPGGTCDYFEIEIGNQICYSAPMNAAGHYFRKLQNKWLPYYEEELRLQRSSMVRNALLYDLDHIPFYVKRRLYFHAFDTLYNAFQKYLQVLFITNNVYPIAYNKWIEEQVVIWLNRPELYTRLSRILSIADIKSNEILDKAEILRQLLREVD